MLASGYPQVRAYGYACMETLLGLTDENKRLALDTLKTENDPYVLKAAIREVKTRRWQSF